MGLTQEGESKQTENGTTEHTLKVTAINGEATPSITVKKAESKDATYATINFPQVIKVN